MQKLSFSLGLLWLSITCGASASAPPLLYVDLGLNDKTLTLPDKIAAQTCIGLFNRDISVAGGVYSLMAALDLDWLEKLFQVTTPNVTGLPIFLRACLTASNVDRSKMVRGYIRYNSTAQQALVPIIITLAGVLDAVPLEDGSPFTEEEDLVFDAQAVFANFSAREATEYVYEKHVQLTTLMSMMNPGFASNPPFKPPLKSQPNVGLADLIVKNRIFNFYMNDACIPGTKEHALMELIVRENPWPNPIPVMGYNSAFSVAGDLFEAESNCIREGNLGQIASDGVNNLAFFSTVDAIAVPLTQNPDPSTTFNASKTYVTVIIGDGDNIGYLKNSRRQWMQQRGDKCAADPSYLGCFPLVWSISPHPLHLAPQIMKWYYNKSYETKNDYFCLPPSGDLYSYPSMMEPAAQAAFVTNTERDAYLLNTSATVEWEWFANWENASKTYYPRYTEKGTVRGLFAVNVPFNLPVFIFKEGELYKVFDGNSKVVLFKPREWRGIAPDPAIPFSRHNYLSVSQQAAALNELAKGSITNIYLTSDGGANLQDVYDMVALLEEHVELVNQNKAVEFALAAAGLDGK